MIAGKPERPLIMGILNVTPDSFSDGGEFSDTESAVRHAMSMAAAGADMIDIGGESTRPGSEPTPVDEQKRRVIPVIEQLREALPASVPISVDTTSTAVAAAALHAGASIINDISAGEEDAGMFGLMAEAGAPVILMHRQGRPAAMQEDPHYRDVVEEIRSYLLARADAAQSSGVLKRNIFIDPGIGFGKTKRHNLELIANLQRLTDSGYPVVLGASRKRFMGTICNIERHSELIAATCATTVLGVLAGVRVFRVHDVKENRQALDVTLAIKNRG